MATDDVIKKDWSFYLRNIYRRDARDDLRLVLATENVAAVNRSIVLLIAGVIVFLIFVYGEVYWELKKSSWQAEQYRSCTQTFQELERRGGSK